MNKQKLTDWFPADVKPARPGIYELAYGNLDVAMPMPFHYWTGSYWANGAGKTVDECNERSRERMPTESWATYMKTAKWRGLAEDPSAKDKP